ncbi:MAG: YbaN family protein [Bacteroidales bacterium]|nr:YbaN family protein [Bacteroidales bacterium]MBN2763532.1 YbaN family protein [Bacteroidales bacterium]
MQKAVLITLGTISLGFGIVGIFVPGLPTTPFLLLTAGLYVRSSERLYQRLISNRYVGPYILEFQRNKGLTLKAKLGSIFLMWLMIFVSAFVFIQSIILKIILLCLGVIGTIVMGFVLPTIHHNRK